METLIAEYGGYVILLAIILVCVCVGEGGV